MQTAPVSRDSPGAGADPAYLDYLVRKPWGHEFRIYDDALMDVWMLRLEPGCSTSMHAHVRKSTVLLCLDGSGAVATHSGDRVPIGPGSVLHIEQGAMHRSTATTGMTLVEIETPRDKLDVLRSADRDRHSSSGDGPDGLELQPLEAVADGPPRARLRPEAAGMFRFGLERGLNVEPGAGGLMFAISLDPTRVLRGEIAVWGSAIPEALIADDLYLTIRSTAIAASEDQAASVTNHYNSCDHDRSPLTEKLDRGQLTHPVEATAEPTGEVPREEDSRMSSATSVTTQPTATGHTPTPAALGLTVAQAHIELASQLADCCARPPRWLGSQDANAPAACAFFLISAASVAWVDAAAAHPRIRAVDVSIEAMGVFAAIEASKATGRPQVVIAGAGPGTLGLNWAIPAARAQGASLLVLAPRTPPHLVGGVDIQESSYRHPSLYHDVIEMEDIAEMPRIALRLRHMFARPQGAVVLVSAPTNLLGSPCPPLPDIHAVEIAPPSPSAKTIARVAQMLTESGRPPAFLLGSDCVPYRDALGPMLERWRAVHFTTPAATRLVPGSLGSIGNGALGDVPARLRELDVRCVVALGTRLGTASGGGNHNLFPAGCQIVQVEIDPNVTAANGVAMWNRPVLSITSDIGEFLAALQELDPAPATNRITSHKTGAAAR